MSNTTLEAMDLIRRFFEEKPEGDLIASFIPGPRATVSAALRKLAELGEIEERYKAMGGNTVWQKARLARAFDLVADQDDWKGEINATVSRADLEKHRVTLEDVREAVIHYTATVPGLSETTGGHHVVTAAGYRAGPAGP